MNFTRTGPNLASTETCEVKIAKRDQLHYVEGNQTTVIPIEIGTDRIIAVSISAVSAARREQIRERIDKALEFRHSTSLRRLNQPPRSRLPRGGAPSKRAAPAAGRLIKLAIERSPRGREPLTLSSTALDEQSAQTKAAGLLTASEFTSGTEISKQRSQSPLLDHE